MEYSKNGISVKIKSETIRARMYLSAVTQKILTVNDQIIDDSGLPEKMINDTLFDFALLSVRIEVKKGKFDFDLANHNDTADEIKSKFDKFLDTEHAVLLDEISAEIYKLDRVQDIDLAPNQEIDETDKKK